MPALKEARSGRRHWRHSGWRIGLGHAFIVAQIAISLLILVAAGLFVRTLTNLQSIDLGFNRESMLLFELNARQAGHRDPEISVFYEDLRKRFSAIPGVRDASLSISPLVGAGHGFTVHVAGGPPDSKNRILTVGPGY
jgi:hypothetical protein